MATEPKKPPPPPLGEIAPPEDPLRPLRLTSDRATAPYLQLLQTSDEVLAAKGGIENLRIYRELLRDDQVASVWQKRRLSLTSCETVVEPGAEDAQSKAAAEALQQELDGLQWDAITDKMLFAAFYGWGVAEVLWKPNGDRVSFDRIVVRDRGRFRFDRDRNLYLWTNGGGWALMPERKFWTVSTGADNDDEPYGIGAAHALYWPVFFKRNDTKFWLIFLEKFGMPTAVAKLSRADLEDPAQRAKAIDMLRLIATDAGVVVPEDTDRGPVVELLEAARSGAADYEGLHRAMNAAISKIVLGQTMTTDDGSSRAQAQVHEGAEQKIVEADADLLCGSFNAGPVRWWTEWNFPGATPPKVYRHTEPPEDLNARADRDSKIKQLGYEPTEEYITETYGEGWKKSETPAPAVGAPPGAAQFAESEAAALQALRAARRGDQEALVDAAVHFAEQYQTIVGRQVAAVLQASEESGDPELFRRRLNEILADGPPDEAVAKLGRAGIFARMLGALRAQRRA